MTIAIDFDGTIVEHQYPAIGKELTFATATLKELQKQGHTLILWTVRAGKELDEAVEFCKARGLVFNSINCSYEGEVLDNKTSRKILADVYVDDRNVGGFPGWSAIWQILNPQQSEAINLWEKYEQPKQTFAQRLKYAFTGKRD